MLSRATIGRPLKRASSSSPCRIVRSSSAPSRVKTPNLVDVDPGLMASTRLLSSVKIHLSSVIEFNPPPALPALPGSFRQWVSLKGTGFSPYIKSRKISWALAPEGELFPNWPSTVVSGSPVQIPKPGKLVLPMARRSERVK